MVTAQPVSDRGLRDVDVRSLLAEQLPHPAGAGRRAQEQPSFAFLLVGRDDVFGDPVDVLKTHGEQPLGHRGQESGVAHLAGHLLQAGVQESAVPDPVPADQRVHRHPALGERAGVLARRGRRLDRFGLDAVFQDVQQRRHVALDGGQQQLHRHCVATEFRDGLDQPLLQARADLHPPELHRAGDRCQRAPGQAFALHRTRLGRQNTPAAVVVFAPRPPRTTEQRPISLIRDPGRRS